MQMASQLDRRRSGGSTGRANSITAMGEETSATTADSRLSTRPERVAGEGEPLETEIASKEGWYPYPEYSGAEPPDGAGA
jgi:hypothetical protein